MTAAKQNGLDAANAEPVKTLTKYARDFIAFHALPASLNVVLFAVWGLLALQVWGALQ